jgi:hypothetical protein
MIMTQYVIQWENDEYQFVGPFPDFATAARYAENEMAAADESIAVTILPVHAPKVS